MKVKYYCPIWGMKHLPLADVLSKIKASGYDGAEIALNPDLVNIHEVKQLFAANGLELLIQHPYGRGATFEEALSNYVSKLEILLTLNPVLINCHSGKDFYTFEQNLQFLRAAEAMAKASGITIAHETHRGTFSFAAMVMGKYLDACPDLKLTADFSHWCVVSESLLENQQGAIDRVIPHCALIHARVGYAQGPQVPNPAAPEYEKELLQHTKWWQQVLDHHKLTNQKELLITCEFGPPPYLQTLPFTNGPVADQYEVNLFMKDYLQKKLNTMTTKSKELISPQQAEFYHENGYLLPHIPLFSKDRFEQLFNIFEEHLANRGALRPDEMNNPHLKDDRLFDFLLAEEVIDVVEAIIGPNIGLWSSGFICKEPKTGKKTPWHEDSAYWEGRFNSFDGIVTIWLAIDEATKENGCMGVVPGTHHNGFSEYEDMGTDHKIFNQQIKGDSIKEDEVVWFALKKGTYSLHDSRIIHGANANTSNTRRTGYTMRYFNTDLVMNLGHPANKDKKVYHARGGNRGGNPLIYR